ncbi:hypothetical protein GCM10023189_59070 [Nibrella saemangeumensis]|uniref:Uncharacterized protein n=1 Tax=Nibrella saemangeumensis TaxID=1084526 RepID=A0ABP8NSS2_9BACT
MSSFAALPTEPPGALEQSEDTAYSQASQPDVIDELEATISYDAEQAKDMRPTVVVLKPDYEVAIDLWLFKFNPKAEVWGFAGIYRDGALRVLELKGYYKRYRPDENSFYFIQSEENIIHEVITTRMLDSVKAYVEADRTHIKQGPYEATYEARSETLKRQVHLLFNDRFLQSLATHTRPILQDTKDRCFIPFKNGIVEVTAKGIRLLPYSMLDKSCVWRTHVIQRDFKPNAPTHCHFATFHRNVSNDEPDRIKSMMSATGYLIHHYNSPSDGQAVILYDEEITDGKTPQGGTGKGVFCKATAQFRPVAVIDGKKFDPNDRFCFQQVNLDTVIIQIDDPDRKKFSFERFYSVLTEGITVEKKNEHAFKIPLLESPKIVISTNSVLESEGSSNIRRQFVLEFSDYYKKRIKFGEKSNPIVDVHGCTFFTDDWDDDEWSRFDRYMVDCVHTYLKDGLQPYKSRNVAANRLKQITGDDFFDWVTTCDEGAGLVPDREYQTAELFNDFKTRYAIDDLKQRGFTNKIKAYAASKGLTYKVSPDKKIPKFSLLKQ